MIAIFIYLIALFFLGIGNAVATYHILRYRDPNDASLMVLSAYYIFIAIVLIITAFSVDWTALF